MIHSSYSGKASRGTFAHEGRQRIRRDGKPGRGFAFCRRFMSGGLGVAVSVVALSGIALGGTAESAVTFITVDPDSCIFWHTATNRTVTVPIDYPDGARSATIRVRGARFARDYEGVTSSSLEIAFPPATAPHEENVYELSLTFDVDAAPLKARLGLVQGYGASGEAATRCLVPPEGHAWNRIAGRAVASVPPGTSAFSVNGTEVDLDAEGVRFWYALQDTDDLNRIVVSKTAGGETQVASLHVAKGMSVIVR